jgi:hypothetical protein
MIHVITTGTGGYDGSYAIKELLEGPEIFPIELDKFKGTSDQFIEALIGKGYKRVDYSETYIDVSLE